MPEPGSKGPQATKPCDPLRFVSDCAPESSAFFWPPHARMLLLPSPVATARSSWAAENLQPVTTIPGLTTPGAFSFSSPTITCIGIGTRHSLLYPLAFRVLDAVQLGLDVGQRREDLAPGFVLIFQTGVSLVMVCPVEGRVSRLEPFALHRFLQGCPHEVGFLHEFIDQVGPFP